MSDVQAVSLRVDTCVVEPGTAARQTLLTLDLGRMKITGTATIGQSPDVLAFDTSLRRLYVSSESGEVAVFAERGRGLTSISSKQWHKVRLVARRNAVTIFLDGRKVGTVSDAKWRTGRVGLGTKADSITRFRKLRITTA